MSRSLPATAAEYAIMLLAAMSQKNDGGKSSFAPLVGAPHVYKYADIAGRINQ